MTFYSVLETAIIGLIGVVSAYHVMKLLMPRVIDRARVTVALRLGRRAVASTAQDAAPESGCGAGCNTGCNGCSIAARVSTLVRADEQALH